MDVEFESADLDRLETDRQFDAGYAREVVRAFRKVMQQLRAAKDERDFLALRSLRWEKLKGDRAGQSSMRLNKQWRLILRIEQGASTKAVVVVEIVDYH